MTESTRLKREKEVYDNLSVVDSLGEVDVFDKFVFETVIRVPEMSMILDWISGRKEGLVLDYGCGPGWLAKHLSELRIECVGIDASQKMCLLASNAAPLSEFLLGDCLRLPFRDGLFDALVGVAILHHLDLDSALRECRRVTRENGVALFFEPNRSNPMTRLANKFRVLSSHTPDETPLGVSTLTNSLVRTGWQIETLSIRFPFGLAASFLIRRIDPLQTGPGKSGLSRVVHTLDRLGERLTFLDGLAGSTIVVVCRPSMRSIRSS